MDVSRLLEADHRKVEALFERIEKSEGTERAALIDELTTDLQAHMELEEDVFYPVMEPVTGAESVQEGVTEHELARKALQDVIRLGPDEPGFGAALDALKAGIEHHVEEEEDEMFPELRKDGQDKLAAMEQPFLAKRAELGLPNDPELLAEVSTKEELLAEAKAAGVSGAASMTKMELAKALTAKA